MAQLEMWECQCGKKIEESKDFIWNFKCFNLECGEVYCINCGRKENIGTSNCNFCGGSFDIHSRECWQRNYEEKQETVIKPLVDKHLEVCDKAYKCDKCQQKFKYKEKWTSTNKGGNYHKSCWEELARKRLQELKDKEKDLTNSYRNVDNNDDQEREREKLPQVWQKEWGFLTL